MQELLNPPSNRRFVSGAGRYGTMDMDTGELDMSAPDPLDLEFRQAQIDATRALVPQRTLSGQAAMIRATKPPAPRGAPPAPGVAPVKSHPSDRYKGRP